LRLLYAAAVVTVTAFAPLGTAPQVPREHAALYDELLDRLDRFRVTLPYSPRRGATAFAAELLAANGNRGAALLEERTFAGAVLYLDRLQKMGLAGVTIQMPYPLLDEGFARSEDYWAFYRRLAGEIRRRKLKLLAKTGPVFTEPEISPLAPDYSGVSWDEYFAARTAIAARIAREIEPDYLTVANEPSTEAAVLRKTPQGPARYARFVGDTLRAMPRTRGRTLVGAGSGTWDAVAFVREMAKTPIDYVDLHIYPLGGRHADYLDRARQMARAARRAGKRAIVGEFWLYKAAASELTGAPTHVEMFGRDTFAFWSPLDQRMLETVAAFAAAEGIEYVSAFWSKYFFAGLDYDRYASQPPGALLRESDRQAAANILANVLTDTGKAYGRIATQR
jgi:hypothetical protein